jgi:hypothetical protein
MHSSARNANAIVAVLGLDGSAVSSGDPDADSNTREKFVAAYDAKHAMPTMPLPPALTADD